jgi:hypothetical protein
MTEPDPAPPADPLARELIDDMMRLGTREYSEVGIPMFLVAEDLREPHPDAAGPSIHWRDIATLFAYRAEILRAQKSALESADVARLVEVFADRYIISSTVPAFSTIPDALAARKRDGDAR